jgi:hypothetical protein
MEHESHSPRQTLAVLFLVLIAGIVDGLEGVVLTHKLSCSTAMARR